MVDEDDNSQNLLDDFDCPSKRNKDLIDDQLNSQAGVKHIKVKNKENYDGDDDEDMLQKYPFHGMNIMVKEEFKPHGLDPRGYNYPYGSQLPSGYCADCKCKK